MQPLLFRLFYCSSFLLGRQDFETTSESSIASSLDSTASGGQLGSGARRTHGDLSFRSFLLEQGCWVCGLQAGKEMAIQPHKPGEVGKGMEPAVGMGTCCPVGPMLAEEGKQQLH